MAANVDSTAMLHAAYKFHEEHPEQWRQLGIGKELTMIHHVPTVPSDIQTLPTVRIECPGADAWCKRCTEGRLGYTFRWYSVLWHDEYMRMKAPHAWRPGDPENIVPDETYGPNFTGNLVNARGELAS